MAHLKCLFHCGETEARQHERNKDTASSCCPGHLSKFVHCNSFPLFRRIIAVMASLFFSKAISNYWHRAHCFALTIILPFNTLVSRKKTTRCLGVEGNKTW